MQGKLKGLLYEKRMTQRQLAKEIGISEKTIGLKMSGECEFTLSEVYKICRVLGIEKRGIKGCRPYGMRQYIWYA